MLTELVFLQQQLLTTAVDPMVVTFCKHEWWYTAKCYKAVLTLTQVQTGIFTGTVSCTMCCVHYCKRVIIGSDQRPETKQGVEGKIVTFRSGRVRVRNRVNLGLEIFDRRSESDRWSEAISFRACWIHIAPNTMHCKISSSLLFWIIAIHTWSYCHAFSVTVSRACNGLPRLVRTATSLSTFLQQLKTTLYWQCFGWVNCSLG